MAGKYTWLVAELIKKTLTSKGRRGQALKKWLNYFQKNQGRMQYASFKGLNIPCGSGCVESAIRRVINLRLKSPGVFWTSYVNRKSNRLIWWLLFRVAKSLD